MNIQVLGSGSKGNAIFAEHEDFALLIDIGFSLSRLTAMLKQAGFHIHNLNAVLISHEHSDHVCGLRQLMKKSTVPVYMNGGTRDALSEHIRPEGVKGFEYNEPFRIGPFTVTPFEVLHDAAEPSGFRIEAGGGKAAVATDLGYATTLVKEHLKGCNVLFLESNHDEGMLMQGPYSWYLKQRIMGKRGHLSNAHAARVIEEVYSSELRRVVLMHLSDKNNTPELARKEHSSFLADMNIGLSVSEQHAAGEVIPV